MITWKKIKQEQEQRGMTPMWGGSRDCLARGHLMNMIWALARAGWMSKEGGDAAILAADSTAQDAVGCFWQAHNDQYGPPWPVCNECSEYRRYVYGEAQKADVFPGFWLRLWCAICGWRY